MQQTFRLLLVLASAAAVVPAFGQSVPKAYLIINLDVHDPPTFAKYRDAIPVVVQKFGGRFLVAGAEPKTIEGNLPFKRMAIIEFPSVDAVEKYEASPEYAAIKEFRTKATRSDIVLVQGVPAR